MFLVGILLSLCLFFRDKNILGWERECEKIIICFGFENIWLVLICGLLGFGKMLVVVVVRYELEFMGLLVYIFFLWDF